MKRLHQILLILALFLILSVFIIVKEARQANKEVTFLYCLDGDSAVFDLNGEEVEVRFLGINCPEKTEAYGVKATDFSKEILSSAQEIELVEDKSAGTKDKYDRYLFWVYADGELLQVKLLENGLAKIEFIEDDYQNLAQLRKAEETAKENKLGIWSYED